MIVLKSKRELALMRQAGRVAAETMVMLLDSIEPGLVTAKLDLLAEEAIIQRGGIPSFKGYRGFPASICVCVNEEVTNSPPGSRRLREGDIVTLILGVLLQGYHAHVTVTAGVGRISAERQRLIEVTAEALRRGIQAATPGNQSTDISKAIQEHAESHGYSVVREYTGHGIGRSMHEDPQIPNYYDSRVSGVRLRPGMTLALQPTVNSGGWRTRVLDDGWTVATADGGLSAHFEHTIAITANGAEVLTQLPATHAMASAFRTETAVDHLPSIQSIRREFAGNRFLGWRAWLRAFAEGLRDGNPGLCEALLDEMGRGGYDLTSSEQGRLTELGDMLHYRQGGVEGLWESYQGRLQACQQDADVATEAFVRQRLGMVFQHQGHYDAARSHYQRSKELGQGIGDALIAQEARDLLRMLEHQETTGRAHHAFRRLWEPILHEAMDPALELRQMVLEALKGQDWRRGREAVAALDKTGDLDTLAIALTSQAQPVRAAAVSVLRRRGPRQCETLLIEALQNESAFVRWQAATALGGAAASAARPLAAALQGDVDVVVRMAAAKALGEVGDRSIIPALRAAPATRDIAGHRLSDVAASAIKRIEQRFPPPPPPKPPPTPPPTPRPVSTAPRIPTRGEAETRAYVRLDLALGAVHVALGAFLVGLANPWMALGYLLYVGLCKLLIEPLAAPSNFFTNKPCYTELGPRSLRRSRARLRKVIGSQLNLSMVYRPLSLLPVLVTLLLLFRAFSWWLLLIPPIVQLIVAAIRTYHKVASACHYCSPRQTCPLWKAQLEDSHRIIYERD